MKRFLFAGLAAVALTAAPASAATVDVLADFSGVAAVTGSAPNRELIWGAYAPLAQNGSVDWAFAFPGQTWQFGNQGTGPDDVPNGGSEFADMNFWAYTTEGGNGVIPEPATWAMMIAGFGLVGFAARRRRTVVTTA